MRKKIIVSLLLLFSVSGYAVKKTVIKVLPKVEIEGKFNEEKAILNYVKKEGYTPKSDIRNTTDKTMEEEVKEIEAEKNGITYTLFVKADEASGVVVTVDSIVKEYYDVLEQIKKEHSKILKIEAATYAKGIDVILYPREHIISSEIKVIGTKVASKIRGINPVPGKITLVIYDIYDRSRILYKEVF
ncbi:hypothetical protein EII29_01480 [Leptotrichia sp. OH3620_COT-345]|uniref:hypothetical protein n=1 Tax=Leptotrichia sp. OH3620_COT-345 TaxID=2491048 RepID=UPI000F65389C|nr:hypothetical protein [Leptotrichia sp. OH3620_COT-345]RRD40639.1 hypothetical protein EII29_01480 [Leptotrichia sp. OH3620_COT-345]